MQQTDRVTYLREKKLRLLQKIRAKNNSIGTVLAEIHRQQQILYTKQAFLAQTKKDYQMVDRELYYLEHPPKNSKEALAQVRDLYGEEAVAAWIAMRGDPDGKEKTS